MRRANYGVDAPGVVKRFILLGAGMLLFALAFSRTPWSDPTIFISLALSFLLAAATMVTGSKVLKLRLRDKVIKQISWVGTERVLDVGCGRGLMLIASAKRLITGKSIGVDIWRQEDQSGNSRAVTLENIQLEGVVDRVELVDADARHLPFPDHSFDIVLSSWVMHNIDGLSAREQALQEIIRVLKPRGIICIIDIKYAGEYAQFFVKKGLLDIKKSSPNFLFVIPSYTVTATKA